MAVDKPPIAIICDNVPPYRLYTHRRLVRELPEVRLWTVYTHEPDPRWEQPPGEEPGLISFADGNAYWKIQLLRKWRVGGRVIRWIQEQRVKAVVLWGYQNIGRIRILNWCWNHNVPCFIFGDSNINDESLMGAAKSFVKRIVLRFLFHRVTGAMPCGTAGRAFFVKYGVPPDRIFPFPYEADYGLIQNLPAERVREVCERFDLSTDRRRLLYCGRLVSVKRVNDLIDAFAAIATRRPDWDLVILGDGELRQELQMRVPGHLRSRVIWAGHATDPAMVSALYRACDVLVLPSHPEPWGLVINEAAASGLAIISTSSAGAAIELVRDRVNGRTYPPGSLRMLTECILDVTEGRHAQEMGAASLEVLNAMRKNLDPVQGLRRALQSMRLLSPEPAAWASQLEGSRPTYDKL